MLASVPSIYQYTDWHSIHVGGIAVDILILAYLFRSKRARETFAAFPEFPDDNKRAAKPAFLAQVRERKNDDG
jgi:hypothetical protein